MAISQRRSERVRDILALCAATLGGVALAAMAYPLVVNANHSVTTPRVFWDCDSDGQADEVCVRITMAGNNWHNARKDRFSAAVNEWVSKTDFDPTIGPGNLREAFLDRAPYCAPFDGAYAVTCVIVYWVDPHFRISDADVFFNIQGGFVWNFATAADLAKADFQGVATHELGHFIWLKDLNLANCGPVGDRYTMCGQANLAETFQVRDLENDDKNSANTVY